MKYIDYIFIAVFLYAIIISALYFKGSTVTDKNNAGLKKDIELYQDSLVNKKIEADSLKVEIKSSEEKIAKNKSSIQIIYQKYEVIKNNVSNLSNDSSVLFFHNYLNGAK